MNMKKSFYQAVVNVLVLITEFIQQKLMAQKKEADVDANDTANLEGKVIGFQNNNILALVQTEIGLAYLDVNDTWFPEIQIGDNVEVESCPFYIFNGRVITMIMDNVIINGKLYKSDSYS